MYLCVIDVLVVHGGFHGFLCDKHRGRAANPEPRAHGASRTRACKSKPLDILDGMRNFSHAVDTACSRLHACFYEVSCQNAVRPAAGYLCIHFSHPPSLCVFVSFVCRYRSGRTRASGVGGRRVRTARLRRLVLVLVVAAACRPSSVLAQSGEPPRQRREKNLPSVVAAADPWAAMTAA